MFYVNSFLVIIICISAKCIFDKWFVLIIEFIWSDNDRVNRVIFLVNCSADLVRICDSRTECILQFFTVPFLKIIGLPEITGLGAEMGLADSLLASYLVRDDNEDSVTLLAIQCTVQPIGKAIHCQILKT